MRIVSRGFLISETNLDISVLKQTTQFLFINPAPLKCNWVAVKVVKKQINAYTKSVRLDIHHQVMYFHSFFYTKRPILNKNKMICITNGFYFMGFRIQTKLYDAPSLMRWFIFVIKNAKKYRRICRIGCFSAILNCLYRGVKNYLFATFSRSIFSHKMVHLFVNFHANEAYISRTSPTSI